MMRCINCLNMAPDLSELCTLLLPKW
jgi:hypothetical protein